MNERSSAQANTPTSANMQYSYAPGKNYLFFPNTSMLFNVVLKATLIS